MDPNHDIIYKRTEKGQGIFKFNATTAGEYMFLFNNRRVFAFQFFKAFNI